MTDSQLFCHLSLSGDRVFICHIPWLPCQDTSGKNVTRTKSNMKIFTWRHFLPFLSTCHINVWIFNNIIIEEYSMCHHIFRCESNSTFTNVCPSVSQSAKPHNSLKSSSFIIQPSSFIILHSSLIILHSSFLHFATFKLFSLFWGRNSAKRNINT